MIMFDEIINSSKKLNLHYSIECISFFFKSDENTVYHYFIRAVRTINAGINKTQTFENHQKIFMNPNSLKV